MSTVIGSNVISRPSAANRLSNTGKPNTLPAPSSSRMEPITSSVNELLEELIRQSVALVGKPVAFMDREDKRRAVRFLSDSGALLITKAGDKIAAAFGISKFTLYNYLDDSKG